MVLDPDSAIEPDSMDLEGEKANIDTDFSSDDLDEEIVFGAANTKSQSLLGQADFVHF